MDLIDRLNTTSYLGREFLTWLWFMSDLQEGLLTLSEDGPAIELFLTDRIVLSGSGQGAERVAIRTEDPSLSYEARTALRQGKKVEKATLRLVSGQREWTVTIDGESLAVSSVKIPALLTRENDEKFHERLALIDQVDAMILALFERFLAIRTDSSKWPNVALQMRDWVRDETPPDRFQVPPVQHEEDNEQQEEDTDQQEESDSASPAEETPEDVPENTTTSDEPQEESPPF
jgi:hypothetical protein